jgi:two-component system, NarL family, nitrate/nitrite response regulator NarL
MRGSATGKAFYEAPSDGPRMTRPAVARQTIGILIIDDHEVVRLGLRHLIEKQPHMKIVGEVTNPADALAIASREKPEIIILDLCLGSENGADIIPELLQITEESRIIVLTGVQDEEALRRASRLGAMGVIAKDAPADMLIRAIDRVHAGELWLNRRLTAALVAELRRPGESNGNGEATMIARLSNREGDIVSLIGEGLKNKQIADRLCISETTVRHHITSILGKLEVSDRLELLIFAYRNNLVSIKR